MQAWQSAPVIGQQPAAQPTAQPRPAQPVQQQPQQPRRIFGAPNTPDPAEQQRLQFEAERLRLAQERLDRETEGKAPSGYRYTADGNLEPIPGGPASAARDGGSIPVSAAQVARESVGQLTSLERAIGTFNDNFAGNPIGGIENTTEAYLGIGTPGQSEWWADFRATDNLIRNSLFGASLTEGEKAAYNQTTITPGMRPEKVRANLERRAQIVRDALAREKEFYIANGYKPEAVEALFAPLRQQRPETATATPPQFGDRDETGVPVAQGGPPAGSPPPLEPDLRPGAGLDSGDSSEGVGIATGETRREDNPVLAGVRSEYARRLAEGQTAEEIIRWARSVEIDPSAYASIGAQVRFRAENPGVPIEQYDTTQLDDRFVPLSTTERVVGNFAASPVGAFVSGAANAATAGTLDETIGLFGGNADRARLAQGAIAERNPVANLAGTVTGGVLATLGGEAALARGGVQAGVGRALAADVGYGAAAGAGNAPEGQRAFNALTGAAAAGVGSAAGQAIGRGLRNAARGSGDPNVQALRDAGVNDLTIGQTTPGRVGNVVRGVEERLSGLPVVGDVVNARRTAGLRQFNQAAFKKALEPIGGSVGDKVGMDAIDDAQSQVSNAFRTALAGKGAVPDKVFGRDLAAAVQGVRSIKRVGDEVSSEVGEIMRPYANDPLLSGEALDDISRNLRTLKANYIASRDPLATRVGAQIDRVERAVFDLFDRQASGTIDDYRKARSAYRRLSTLEDAVLKAQNQPDNVFTAAQLGRADTSNTRRFGGKRAAARGDTPFNELQQAGQAVLPNRVPDSGTAGRLGVALVPLAAIGGGAGADQLSGNTGTGLTIGAIIAGLYSRTGQRVLTKPARGLKQGSRGRVLLENPNTGRALGVIGAGTGGALANQ